METKPAESTRSTVTTVVTHPFTVIEAHPDEVAAGSLTPERQAAAVESIRVHGAAVVLGAVDLGVVDSLRVAMLADLPRALEKPRALNIEGHIQHNPPLRAAHLHRDVIANPIGLSIIKAIIGPVQLTLYSGNTMLGGTGQEQPLHWDEYQLWPAAEGPPPPAELTMNIPLVDVDVANGALEVWPGTHLDLRSGPLSHSLEGLEVPHEWVEARRAEVPPVRVPMPKGALLIRDGRLWHRGTTNSTDEPRPMVAACYNAWWYRPMAIDFHEDAEPVLRELGVRVTARFRADFDDQEWPPNWELVPKPLTPSPPAGGS